MTALYQYLSVNDSRRESNRPQSAPRRAAMSRATPRIRAVVLAPTRVRSRARAMPTAVAPRASPHPELTVFDLDACTWDKEMFELREIVDPTRSRRGSLGPDCGEGVVAAMSGNTPIALHPGALRAFQQIWLGTLETRAAAASSADTPLAVRIGRSALDVLEVFPGVTVRQVFAKGWPEGFEGNLQIGRTPPLSPDKARTHFPILRRETGVAYSRMLFFDDCNWGDHCAAVERGCVCEDTGLGPVVVRTPRGLRVDDWERGLSLYAARIASWNDAAS